MTSSGDHRERRASDAETPGLDLVRRLTLIEDQLAIRELRNRYCAYVDAEMWDEASALFTADGIFEGIEVARGRDAIRDWFSRSVPGTFDKTWHMCTNATTFIEGGCAHGTTAFTFYAIEKGQPLFALGHYTDRLRKSDGNWRFEARGVTFESFCAWSEGFRATPPQGNQVPRRQSADR